jgi:hypothetical protein
MSFPADILLPPLSAAKYFSFKNNSAYNSNYDITWSISCLVSSVSAQYGICTFLTTLTTSPVSALPGQYIGTYIPNNLISIAFDTTGLFALSSTIRPGVPRNQIKPSSLVVRNSSYNVIYNETLSGTGFNFYNTNQIIRCRYSNPQQTLFIDYRKVNDRDFINLATIPISSNITNILNTDNIYTGFSFCSPISTTTTPVASAYIYNFHTDGVKNNTTVEVVTAAPLI